MDDNKYLIDALDELNDVLTIDFDNDPEFIADFLKGMIVQDILTIMENKKITKNELSKMIGKSRQYISKILSEKTNFTVHTLTLISLALGCELKVSIENKNHEINILNFESDNYHERLKDDKKVYLDQFTCENNFLDLMNTHYDKVLDHKRESTDESNEI